MVMCFMPLLYLFLFGYMYSPHVVNQIPTVILDFAQTETSRTIVQGFQDTDRFKIIAEVGTEQEVQEMIDSRQAVAGVVIPEDLDQSLKKRQGSEVLIMVNGTNMMYSNSVVSSANEIVATISAGISMKTLGAVQGAAQDAVRGEAIPLSFRTKILYNPTYNYANFLLLGLMGTAIQQMVFMYVAISFCREKEQKLFPALLEQYSVVQIIAAKVISYLLINMFSMNLVLSMCILFYKIPFRGSLLALELLFGAFILAVSGLGILLSLICKGELEATQYAMLVAVPSFLFSGFTWPLSSMHGLAWVLNRILPLTYLVNDVRDIALMGIGLEEVCPSILVLAAIAAVLIPVSGLLVKLQGSRYSSQNTLKMENSL